MPASIRTTVVIPAFSAWATLPLVLDALGPQLGSEREAVLVDSSPDAAIRARSAQARWPWLRVITLERRTPPGRARNIGAKEARGTAVAFVDADAVPAVGWLDNLEAGLQPELDAVAGAIANGTPDDPVGTAGYLLEFSEWLPERSSIGHAAGCNLLVRREAFLESGGMPEDMWQGEDTAATIPLSRARRLAFAPSAIVSHLNRTARDDFLRHQREQGAAYRDLCQRGVVGHSLLTARWFTPAVFSLRLAALVWRLVPYPRVAWQALRFSPLMVRGLLAWCGGVRRPDPALEAKWGSKGT